MSKNKAMIFPKNDYLIEKKWIIVRYEKKERLFFFFFVKINNTVEILLSINTVDIQFY